MTQSIAVTCLTLILVAINPIKCDGGGHGHGHDHGHAAGHAAGHASGHTASHTSGHSSDPTGYVSDTSSSYVASEPTGYSSVSLTGKSGAEQKMQQQFLFLMSAIADSVDPAIASVKEDLENNNFRAQSYGVALVAGGVGDSVAEYVENNRNPQDILTVPAATYQYGYNIGYGIGFGGPFLLPSYLSDTSFGCSSQDFLRLVSEYQYGYGVPANVGSTELTNFGLDAKGSLHCLLQYTGDYQEAARVDYLIDDLVEAGQAVVALRG